MNKAFKNTGLTFMVTVLYLSATFAAAGSLALILVGIAVVALLESPEWAPAASESSA